MTNPLNPIYSTPKVVAYFREALKNAPRLAYRLREFDFDRPPYDIVVPAQDLAVLDELTHNVTAAAVAWAFFVNRVPSNDDFAAGYLLGFVQRHSTQGVFRCFEQIIDDSLYGQERDEIANALTEFCHNAAKEDNEIDS